MTDTPLVHQPWRVDSPAAALTAARSAAAGWAGREPLARARILLAAVAALPLRGAHLPTLSTPEGGAHPQPGAEAWTVAQQRLLWWSGWCDKLDLVGASAAPAGATAWLRPCAVVAAAAPAHASPVAVVDALAPALAVGATVLLAGHGPVLAVARPVLLALADAGLPAGAAQVCQAASGQALTGCDVTDPGAQADPRERLRAMLRSTWISSAVGR